MNPIKHPSATHCFAPPPNWDEAKDGPCESLWVTAQDESLVSVWRPTDEERRLIAKGADVALFIWAAAHPVVSLTVTEKT